MRHAAKHEPSRHLADNPPFADGNLVTERDEKGERECAEQHPRPDQDRENEVGHKERGGKAQGHMGARRSGGGHCPSPLAVRWMNRSWSGMGPVSRPAAWARSRMSDEV